MKQFSCGDVVPGCNVRFSAKDDDGVLAQVATHARDDHGLTEIPASLVDLVRSKITLAA